MRRALLLILVAGLVVMPGMATRVGSPRLADSRRCHVRVVTLVTANPWGSGGRGWPVTDRAGLGPQATTRVSLQTSRGQAAWASDWVEDSYPEGAAAPKPAPEYFRSAPGGNVNADAGSSNLSGRKPVFRVYPDANGTAAGAVSGKSTLEGGVTKWTPETAPHSSSAPSPWFAGGTSWLSSIPFFGGATHQVPPSVFRGWLERTHPTFALSSATMNRGQVLEIRGAWDNADHTLRSFGIPHERIKSGELRQMSLAGVKVMVVNCAGEVPREALQTIRDWVGSGGYLLTTDWALDNLLARAFPGYVAWNGGFTGSEVCDAYVVDALPELFAGTTSTATWKADEKSQTLRVLNYDRVHILVRSRRLAGDDPDGQGVLAVTFSFGRGKVLHLVGHFDNNSNLAFVNSLPDSSPVFGISLRQALACNFIVEGLTRRAHRTETPAVLH